MIIVLSNVEYTGDPQQFLQRYDSENVIGVFKRKRREFGDGEYKQPFQEVLLQGGTNGKLMDTGSRGVFLDEKHCSIFLC